MIFIPHQWSGDDDNIKCSHCGITGEQFDFIRNRASMPTCTFSDVTAWWEDQPDIIPQAVIEEAKRLYEA